LGEDDDFFQKNLEAYGGLVLDTSNANTSPCSGQNPPHLNSEKTSTATRSHREKLNARPSDANPAPEGDESRRSLESFYGNSVRGHTESSSRSSVHWYTPLADGSTIPLFEPHCSQHIESSRGHSIPQYAPPSDGLSMPWYASSNLQNLETFDEGTYLNGQPFGMMPASITGFGQLSAFEGEFTGPFLDTPLLAELADTLPSSTQLDAAPSIARYDAASSDLRYVTDLSCASFDPSLSLFYLPTSSSSPQFHIIAAGMPHEHDACPSSVSGSSVQGTAIPTNSVTLVNLHKENLEHYHIPPKCVGQALNEGLQIIFYGEDTPVAKKRKGGIQLSDAKVCVGSLIIVRG
jgi:hypothetical protein